MTNIKAKPVYVGEEIIGEARTLVEAAEVASVHTGERIDPRRPADRLFGILEGPRHFTLCINRKGPAHAPR